MMRNLLFLILPIWCLMFVSTEEYDPVDNYLINCGSSENTTLGGRVFFADRLNSTILSTPSKIFAKTNFNLSVPFPFNHFSPLYQTARILNGTSEFTFPMKKRGRHWIRLHFFPFIQENHNLTSARFSVSAQNFTLLKDFQPSNVSILKEYSLNISSDQLVLVFTPTAKSFAFINAIEVISLPDEVIPAGAGLNTPEGSVQDLRAHALETFMRVNMGNVTIPPQNDTLGRLWFPDAKFLKSSDLVQFETKEGRLNYSAGGETENIAPPLVYESVTRLKQADFDTRFNATWRFDVDPGFEYLIRFHFCDIVSDSSNELLFNVYINSLVVSAHLDLKTKTKNTIAAPYHMDVVKKLSTSGDLSVTIGPSEMRNVLPDGILNGLEIMKISNSKNSLEATDAEVQVSKTSSKSKRWVLIGPGLGAICLVCLALAFIYILIRRSRRRAAMELSKYSEEPSSLLKTNTGYLIPFKAVQEATDNFCEEMVIGIGGFGKVYKGILKDGTKVAVKRGNHHSNQGLSEFMTEIEMLSKFRHRHLVSLIGYCDEMNEMIIVYEYMENGALKNHLYGSEDPLPKLNWRQRLEICIGSARGLHYLHTGSEKAIIHRDVKSANILLDENLMAKVADFGLSKDGPEIDQTHVSTAVKGSFGYLDPEYLTRQQLTEKSDVYSFGVVMLEILSGRPVIDPSRPKETANLIEWAMKEMKKGELETILDPYIKGGIKMESLQKFAETVEKCLAECGPDRPTMGEVLWNLESALQLQCKENGRTEEGTLNAPLDDIGTSTSQFSAVSMGDLEGVSMSRAFSQLVKSDMKDLSDKI